jgi:hypothetical protein
MMMYEEKKNIGGTELVPNLSQTLHRAGPASTSSVQGKGYFSSKIKRDYDYVFSKN